MAELEIFYPLTGSTSDYYQNIKSIILDENNIFKNTFLEISGGISSSSMSIYLKTQYRWFFIIQIGYQGNSTYPFGIEYNYRTTITEPPSGNTLDYNKFAYDTEFYNADYSTVPVYRISKTNSCMVAFKNLKSMIVCAKGISMTNSGITKYTAFVPKHVFESEEAPLGLYRYDGIDRTPDAIYATTYHNPNTGYCSKYMMYNYVDNGYIYPDIYYCDGGIDVPPDGICQIGTTKFLKLASNFFLKVD